MVAILLFLSLAPLCFFVGPMSRAKRIGRIQYGTQASHYVNEFRRKWLQGNIGQTEPFLECNIQSLADLANSYNVVSEMRLFPIGTKALALFALVVVVAIFAASAHCHSLQRAREPAAEDRILIRVARHRRNGDRTRYACPKLTATLLRQ